MSMSAVTCHRFDALPPDVRDAWPTWRADTGPAASPYYRMELFDDLHAVTGTVEVAVFRDPHGAPRGVLPFQRTSRPVARAAGMPLTDYQGVIGSASGATPSALLRACRLRALIFDHVPADHTLLAPGTLVQGTSKVIDLSGGFDAWAEDRKRAGSSIVSQTDRKARKFARDLGEPTFDSDDRDTDAFATVLAWKRSQYAKTHVPDHLRPAWARDWLSRLFHRRNDDLRLELSTIRVRGQLVAGNLSLRSGSVVHWWFPSYDPAWADHSPGAILMLNQIRHAAEVGRLVIDLGQGDEAFKLRFANRTVPLIAGGIDERPLAAKARSAWYGLRGVVRSSTWGRLPLEAYRRLRAMAGP